MRVFKDAVQPTVVFEWDEDQWKVSFNTLTLADRKDIARLCRVHPEPEWPQRQLQFTLSRAIVTANDRQPEKGWEAEVLAAPESLVTLLADAYREARLVPATMPDDPSFVEGAREVCARYIEGFEPRSLVKEDEDIEVFSILAPIARYVWWSDNFYLVHYHILTLDERRIIAKLLDMIPPDQCPHVEIQHTLARSIVAVNGTPVSQTIGEGLDIAMDWVDEFPESLIAILAAQYDLAKAEPRGQLFKLLAESDPKLDPTHQVPTN